MAKILLYILFAVIYTLLMIDGGLRPLISSRIRGWQWTPIESGLTLQGIPDLEFCAPEGVQGWIECKRTLAYAVRMRAGQVAWIDRRVRMGGRVYIAVRRRDELYVFHGRGVRALAEGGLPAASAALLGGWSGGPAKWDWEAVKGVLKNN